MPAANETIITPEMDRHNGRIFFVAYLMVYLSAPAVYVGVVQAALCDRLHASAALANLPASTYLLGQLAPLIFSWLIPHRHEKNTLIWASVLWAALVAVVLFTLITPQPDWLRIAAVSAQGLVQGVAASVAQVFSLQCLKRGTTEAGRAWSFKWTFSLGPIAAVAASLAAQYALKPGFSWAPFPYDFALIYGMATPCLVAMIFLNTRWKLTPLADVPRVRFGGFLKESFRGYCLSRPLVLLFLAFTVFMCAQALIPTLVLHAREAMNQDPENISGAALVMRFGCKALGGYLMGVLAMRFDLRASVALCLLATLSGMLWAGLATGYWYLFAFGLMGAGELGGIFFPALGLALSPANISLRNISILNIAIPASSFAPVVLGALKDHFGFRAALLFAVMATLIGLAALAGIKRGAVEANATA